MSLTDIQVKALRAQQATRKYFDERGLYLEVTPSGSKRWRFKYRFAAKEKLLSLGLYPDVGLRKARELRDIARRHLSDGLDPSAVRKADRAGLVHHASDEFEFVAREWLQRMKLVWSPTHLQTVTRSLERDVFPFIGRLALATIDAQVLLTCLRKIEDRGAHETSHRALSNIGQIFRYGISIARTKTDPSKDLKGALSPVRKGHFSAITDQRALAAILRMIDGYQGTPVVTAALKLAPLLFVRPGELRQAEWKDFNFERKEWCYVVSKTNTPHIVPLSERAVALLRELHPHTGRGQYLFPSPKTFTRPISDNALRAALRSMGITNEQTCVHGFRATARTLLDEALGFPAHLIEHQLAHNVRDPLGRSYNRTTHLKERRDMMERWAEFLGGLVGG